MMPALVSLEAWPLALDLAAGTSHANELRPLRSIDSMPGFTAPRAPQGGDGAGSAAQGHDRPVQDVWTAKTNSSPGPHAIATAGVEYRVSRQYSPSPRTNHRSIDGASRPTASLVLSVAEERISTSLTRVTAELRGCDHLTDRASRS